MGCAKKTKTYLSEKGVAFREYDVERSKTGRREYKRLNGKGVPIILVGDQRMDGFDRSRLEVILRKNGLLWLHQRQFEICRPELLFATPKTTPHLTERDARFRVPVFGSDLCQRQEYKRIVSNFFTRNIDFIIVSA